MSNLQFNGYKVIGQGISSKWFPTYEEASREAISLSKKGIFVGVDKFYRSANGGHTRLESIRVFFDGRKYS